jgi:hypothetical protein
MVALEVAVAAQALLVGMARAVGSATRALVAAVELAAEREATTAVAALLELGVQPVAPVEHSVRPAQ